MVIEPPGIDAAIITIRGQRVILSADLARIYGVETRALNQAVKRNANRFPRDFVLRLTRNEGSLAARSRSQSVILKRGENIKHLPLAFTEHGAIMAATVLNSPTAVQMSVFVVRAFLRLRTWVANQAVLAARLKELERRVGRHDDELRTIIKAVRSLIAPSVAARPRQIGFGRR